jgi:SpoVK/Ycf46/Vps4 family AAA+-type ATPase
LDVGRLLGKYVGESEDNLRRAIQLAEAATPCVLWIDEIEKAFAGVGKDASGGGVTTRLFGYFLTWMQEKDSTVYVVATANDITGIPPEFLRKGRFDEIFSVRLPDNDERKRIFEIHLKRRHKDWRELNLRLNELVQKTKGKDDKPSYSGADIESIVKTGIETAFTRRQLARLSGDADWKKIDLTQEDLVKAIENTTPIRETLSDKIDALEKSLKKFQITSASSGNWTVAPKYK